MQTKSNTEDEVVAATQRFLREWKELLQRDSQKVGFLPVAALLQICSNHVTAIRASVRESFQLAARSHLKSGERADMEEIEQKVRTTMDSGHAARFFSVDMSRIASPTYYCWTLEHLVEAFNYLKVAGTNVYSHESFPEPGLLAAIYGEVEIDCTIDAAGTRLKFCPGLFGSAPGKAE